MIAAVLTVATIYGYFLIFAQFGFLQAVRQQTGGAAGAIRPVMAVMGLAGLAGSVAAAAIFSIARSRRLLAAGFIFCAGAAGLAMAPVAMTLSYVIALLTGLGTGLTTVTLAGVLRRAVGNDRLGTVIGLGTGLAYGCCNLPAVFNAGAHAQALVGVLAAGAGLVAATALRGKAPARPPTGGDYSKPGITVWVLVFLALVGLDSAAFYIIQHTPDLKAATWSGAGQQEAIAGMHLAAAGLAGYALDRRWVGRTMAIGAGALLVACHEARIKRAGWGGPALCSGGFHLFDCAGVLSGAQPAARAGGRGLFGGRVGRLGSWHRAGGKPAGRAAGTGPGRWCGDRVRPAGAALHAAA